MFESRPDMFMLCRDDAALTMPLIGPVGPEDEELTARLVQLAYL